MRPIDWRQVLLCGTAAGLSWSLMTLPVLILSGGGLIDAVPRPLLTPGRIGSFSLNLVSGIWAVWLSAAIRPHYGNGLGAAAIAGFSWWLLATIATWQWVEIGFIPVREVIGLIVASLPILTAVTIGGAWLYQRNEALRATRAN